MAVTDLVPGIEVTVTQNGEALKEYEDTETLEDERTFTRYIISECGKNFEIGLKARKGTKFEGDVIACDVYVDERWVDAPLLMKEITQITDHTEMLKGFRLQQDTIRRFEFADLQTVSDEYGEQMNPQDVKNLGRIVVQVYHESRIKELKVKNETIDPALSLGTINEKSLKGQSLSHSVKFGDAETKVQGPTWRTRRVPGAAYATFIFYYRSLQAMKSMLIIPRTPSPPPLEEQDITKMTPEQLMELQEQFRALKRRESDRIKIKHDADGDDDHRPRKKARTGTITTLIEMDEDGNITGEESVLAPTSKKVEVIELD